MSGLRRFWRRLRRMWAMTRLYWGTPDYDWSTIALLMRHQIERTRQHMLTCGIRVDAERSGRQMLIAETLLQRLMDDPYFAITHKRHPTLGAPSFGQHMLGLERQDREMLANILRRHLCGWWD